MAREVIDTIALVGGIAGAGILGGLSFGWVLVKYGKKGSDAN